MPRRSGAVTMARSGTAPTDTDSGMSVHVSLESERLADDAAGMFRVLIGTSDVHSSRSAPTLGATPRACSCAKRSRDGLRAPPVGSELRHLVPAVAIWEVDVEDVGALGDVLLGAAVDALLEVLRVDVRFASRCVIEGFDRQDRVGVFDAAVVLVEFIAGLGARRVGVGLAGREVGVCGAGLELLGKVRDDPSLLIAYPQTRHSRLPGCAESSHGCEEGNRPRRVHRLSAGPN